jgi:hypothetical protein
MTIDRTVNLFIVVLHLKIMNLNPCMLIIFLYFNYRYFYICYRSLDTTAKFETNAWIERIIILGYPKNPSRVIINSGNKIEKRKSYFKYSILGDKQAIPLHSYQDASQMLIIRRPGPSVTADWTLTIS